MIDPESCLKDIRRIGESRGIERDREYSIDMLDLFRSPIIKVFSFLDLSRDDPYISISLFFVLS